MWAPTDVGTVQAARATLLPLHFQPSNNEASEGSGRTLLAAHVRGKSVLTRA
jgi:hypothetical protein